MNYIAPIKFYFAIVNRCKVSAKKMIRLGMPFFIGRCAAKIRKFTVICIICINKLK